MKKEEMNTTTAVSRQGQAAQPDSSATPLANAGTYEETHVHGVYEAIASHFSATRHKPWPFVSSFLASQPAGAVGLDVGCGNGKNMGVNRDVAMLGCDRSAALVALARDMWCRQAEATTEEEKIVAGADVAVADGLDLPFRAGCADFVICIAVVHHLSTRERRVEAIRELLRCIQRGAGQVLVYVWALEQSSSRRGWGEGGEQDLLVPWVMKAPQQKKKKQKVKTTPKPRKNKKKQPEELEVTQEQKQGRPENNDKAVSLAARQEDATSRECEAGGGGEGGEDLQQQGRRQQSHGSEAEDGAAAHAGAAAAEVASTSLSSSGERKDEPGSDGNGQVHQGQVHTATTDNEDKTFHRFYHLYRKGELEEDVVAAGGEVLRSGYERDNWWVIAG